MQLVITKNNDRIITGAGPTNRTGATIKQVYNHKQYRILISRASSWLINKLNVADYERFRGITDSLACADTFNVGEYTIIICD